MTIDRFGSTFPRLFVAAFLQELSWTLLIHLPGYLTELGATEALIGILYAVSAAISLAFRPTLGRILDLTRRRTVILVAGASNILVLLALVTTEIWGPYLWLLFLTQHTLQIALFTTMLTYAADSIPVERRTQGLAIFGLSGLVPIAMGGYVGDVVIGATGFGGLFVIAALFGVASWLVVWTLPTLPVRGRRPRRGFWAAFAQKNLLPLWFVILLFSTGLTSLFTFVRTYVDTRQLGTVGIFFGIYGLSAALTRILGGRLYDRIPHRSLLIIGISGYGIGLVLLALAGSIPVFVLAALISGTAHGASFPVLSSAVVNRARIAERGSAMAIFTSLFDIALLIGAPAVGFLIDGFDYLVAFGVAGLIILAGAVVYGIWDRRLLARSALVAEKVLE